MKKNILLAIPLTFITFSCQTKVLQKSENKNINPTFNNSKSQKVNTNAINSIDWVGKYKGILPCANCEGIKYTLELKKNGNFILEQEYLGKETVYQDEGFYKWDDIGNSIHLNSNISPLFLKVEKNILKVLDENGKEYIGEHKDLYILKKMK